MNFLSGFFDAQNLPRIRSLLVDLVRYGVVSLGALVIDWGALSLFSRGFGLSLIIASTTAFLLGLLFVYFCSVNFVFAGRSKFETREELAWFLLTGVLGLGINYAILHFCGEVFGLAPDIAKIFSSAVVFNFNFFIRRAWLFIPS